MQPGKPGGLSGEVPARFRAFSPAGQAPASEVAEPEPEAAETVADQPENQPVETAETTPAPDKALKLRERGLLLPVEEPSWIGRLLQSTLLRIVAVVIGAALALYVARDQFRGVSKEVPLQQSETPALAQPATPTPAEPAAQLARPPATAVPSSPPVQELPEAVKTGKEVAEPPISSAAAVSTTKD